MTEFLNHKEDFIGVVENFDSLSTEMQDLVVHLADNATEVAIQMYLAEKGGPNQDLFSICAKDIITNKLVRRIIYASQQGLSEEQIMSAVEQGFKYSVPHQ